MKTSLIAVMVGVFAVGGSACLLPCEQTCGGCCTANGACLPGTEDTACGFDGQQCVACAASKHCALNTCGTGSGGGGGGGGGSGTDGGSLSSDAGTTVWVVGQFGAALPSVVRKVDARSGAFRDYSYNAASVHAFAISPDFTKAAVALNRNISNQWDVWMATPQGTATALVTQLGAMSDVNEIAFSPDGQKVAVISTTSAGFREVHVVAFAENQTARLVSPPRELTTTVDNAVLAIAFSRSSRYLALVGDFHADHQNELVVVDLQSPTVQHTYIITANAAGHPSPLYPTTGAFGRPQWTTDDAVVVLARLVMSVIPKLYWSHPDGTAFELLPQVPQASATIAAFGLSASGTTLAFASDVATPGGYEVYVVPMTLASTTPTRVTSGTAAAGYGPNPAEAIVFSPDETKLAFAANYLNAGADEPYVAAMTENSAGRVAVTGKSIEKLVWSPLSNEVGFLCDVGDMGIVGAYRALSTATSANPAPVPLATPATGGRAMDMWWTPASSL